MAKSKIIEKIDAYEEEQQQKLLDQNIEDIFGDRFGAYAKYIIQDRAIPDVRDGLKPVQRRILYAMNKMGMAHDKPYKKSARIVGEVMGKYHPHGDSSIYEAMVRMSQSFKTRIPLIDMHGNNGSIDGDSPAAMRYTEARLSKEAELLLENIEKNTVDMVLNFDDEELEPIVLPAKFPNLLVNGANGISAGYATEIPPHNLSEVIDASIYYMQHPNCTVEDILNIIQGPDFPTGGIIHGIEGLTQAYTTGRGKILVRSKTHFEEITKGQSRLVVTEIPYEVNKAELVKKIDQIRIDHKFEDLLEVRDESDREGLRIAIDLKKNANPELAFNYLMKNTDLQVYYNFNMVSIINRKPVCSGILPFLDSYIHHQKEVITNRSNYDLAKSTRRLSIVDGLIKMVSILDQVIATIRASQNKSDSKANLIQKFDFTEDQAEAIVTMQLYRLSNTDVLALQKEQETLHTTISALQKILSSEKELQRVIQKEMLEVKANCPCPRLTVIENKEIENIKIDSKDLIGNDDVMVSISRDGYVKRSSLKSFNSTPQGGMKDKDIPIFEEICNMKDTLLIFTNRGYYIFQPVYELKDQKWKDMGMHISNLVNMGQNELIVGVIKVTSFHENKGILMASKNGLVKQTMLQEFEVTRYKSSMKCMNLPLTDSLVSVDIMESPSYILITSKCADTLKFPCKEISYTKTSAGGVLGIRLSEGDQVVSAVYARSYDDLLLLTNRGNVKRVRVSEIKLFSRYRKGMTMIKMIKSNPHYIVDTVRLSPVQFKENVTLHLINAIKPLEIHVKDLKYSPVDSGKQMITLEEYGAPAYMKLDASKEKEEIKKEEIEDPISKKVISSEPKEDFNSNIFKDLDIDLEDKDEDDSEPINLFHDFLE